MSALTARAEAPARAKVRVTNGHVLTAGSLILLLPNILFAVQLRPLPAAIVLAGAVGATALLQSRRETGPDSILAQPLALSRLGTCLALAVTLLVLGGEGHLVFTDWDWLWRDSVLADLTRRPFPPIYEIAGQTFFLRAPLGMYMLPALVAKATSLGAGHAALLVQNAALLTLVLYLFATLAGRRAALAVVVFLSFSGLDVIGELVMWLVQGKSLASFVLPSHIENWTVFQYSSVITQLFWVPNHALPSYWLALIVLFCARREATLGTLGLVMAASLFWSPFAVIGTLPFGLYLFARDARALVSSPRFWLAAAASVCFLPVALYMQVDAAQVPHAFILFAPFMVFLIALFLLIEIPHVAIVRIVWGELDPWLKGVLATAILFLVVLPTVRVGVADDIVMRASIPALMILALAFAQALAASWPRRPALVVAGVALVIVGAVTPAQEVIRAMAFPPYAISDCNLVTVWKKIGVEHAALENYLARTTRLPDGLIGPAQGSALVDRPGSVCWPDIPYDPRSHIGQLSNAMLKAAPKHDPI